MVAVSILMRYRPCSRRHKDVLVAGLLALTGAGLMSCASTQELYAEYDQQFCPVDGVGVVVPASTTVQKMVSAWISGKCPIPVTGLSYPRLTAVVVH